MDDDLMIHQRVMMKRWLMLMLNGWLIGGSLIMNSCLLDGYSYRYFHRPCRCHPHPQHPHHACAILDHGKHVVLPLAVQFSVGFALTRFQVDFCFTFTLAKGSVTK